MGFGLIILRGSYKETFRRDPHNVNNLTKVAECSVACSGLRDSGGKSRSVIRNAKNARGLGRDRAAEPVRIFLTACSGISAPDIPSDWSIVTVSIIT